ncbi:uncharacterized protein LOC143251131 [Tachypleus tridentatus]|uniref:uncharacterized protein LOC143251131 n=2 Tax=Tachypleus tridentatus TaxID=6853 RepID=UPI003FD292A9
MADLTPRMITFSVSRSTSDDHQEHFKNENLQESCSDCQNILKDMKTFHDQLRKHIVEDETARAQLIENFSVLISSREESFKSLKKLDIKINVKISKTAASLSKIRKIRRHVSNVGGNTAPVTNDVSLDLTEGDDDSILKVAGEPIALGSNTAGSGIDKTKCKEVKRILEKDKQQTDQLLKNMETYERCDENREKLVKEAEEFIDIVENGLNGDNSLVGPLGKAVEFLQNLASLEEVTFESADEVLRKAFMSSPTKAACDQVDLKSPSSPISPNLDEGREVSKLRSSGPNITTSSLPPVCIKLETVATALDVANKIFASQDIEEDSKSELQDRITELIKEITREKEEIEKAYEHIKA